MADYAITNDGARPTGAEFKYRRRATDGSKCAQPEFERRTRRGERCLLWSRGHNEPWQVLQRWDETPR